MPIAWLAGALVRRLAGTIVISAIGAVTFQLGLWACFGWAGVQLGPYSLLAGPACPA